MSEVNVIRYNKEKKKEWNDFLCLSKNGHFIFERNYMDYHSHKFEDCSLMFFDQKDKVVAIFPANISNNILYSHQGLTFGGMIVRDKITTPEILNVFDSLILFCEKNEIEKVIYKRIPDFYCDLPVQDDLYALFIKGFKLTRCDVNSTVKLQEPYSYSKGRKWSINKAKKEAIEVIESKDYDLFWRLLSDVLSHHNAIPTHTVSEIESLSELFPSNIKLYLAKKNNEILAGTVLFLNKNVVHTQYMASSDLGRQVGALDYLVHQLMSDNYSDKKYFNFGISTEQSGAVLNEGLLSQKNGFGAKTTVHQFYEIQL
jgi:hypothetical protein